ncbi:MAG: Nramp family divalent metal transporter [Nitrososphaerota archaeon]|nr:Nramp family divalent metal transporter [Nitrososphaerota archaeon]MDG6939897.1 Nramp family divalent metal transporter [Nitrososphaerota archaeon]
MTSGLEVSGRGRGFLAKLLAYSGPALMVSVAYMDPGNYGTDLAAGHFHYDLLWVVWLASFMAMLLQYLSGKLGIATGRDLAEEIRLSLGRRRYAVPYWLASELSIAATDLAEYMGTVLALNMLFGVPLLYASVFGAADVLIILAATSRRLRVMEQLFAVWITVIGAGFLYEMVIVRPDLQAVVVHSFLPALDAQTIAIAVGIIGATVMPHAVYLHSWLTKNKVKTGSAEEKRGLLALHRAETVLLLVLAAFVNAAIVMMAAATLDSSNAYVSGVGQYYKILVPLFGPAAAVIFAVTLLASGLSSSTTGTLAGQAVMDGMLGTKVNPYARRVVTRFLNVIPTTAAIMLHVNPLDLLVYSQVVLSLMLPLPMIPLIVFTSDRKRMGEFVNRRGVTVLVCVVAAVIIAFNAYLIFSLL